MLKQNVDSRLPWSTVLLPSFRYREADEPPDKSYHQKVRSSLTLHHNACVTHLTSSPHGGILSSHILSRRRVSTIGYFERRRDHICIIFITVCCCNYSIVFLVVAVNFFLCPIYKSDFIIGILYIGKKHSTQYYYLWFQAFAGGLGMYSLQTGKTTVVTLASGKEGIAQINTSAFDKFQKTRQKHATMKRWVDNVERSTSYYYRAC